jgi:hypothetical protein
MLTNVLKELQERLQQHHANAGLRLQSTSNVEHDIFKHLRYLHPPSCSA